MKNLVLDAGVVLDLLCSDDLDSQARRATEEAVRHGYRLWVAAASLPGIATALEGNGGYRSSKAGGPEFAGLPREGRSLLQEFFRNVGVLSCHGFRPGDLPETRDVEGWLVRRAAEALGENALILCLSEGRAGGDPRVISPQRLLGLLDAEPARKNLPFIDLQAQQARILTELEARVLKVFRHGQYILGPEVKQLEQSLASFTGTRYAITCASGTDALLLALMAYGVGPGDAIFTSPFTFIATAEVIALLGATPVFVDIDPSTYNLDAAGLRRAVRAVRDSDAAAHVLPRPGGKAATGLKPRGIMAVDLFGLPADYREINRVAGESGLFVIEDAAQSFGALYHGRRSCALSAVGCTSFFPAKPLGCYGDGGAVFTDDDSLARVMLSLRVHGQGADKYDNVRVGLNARMDTLQAAILLPKLAIFPEELEARDRVARSYTERLRSLPSVVTPRVPEGLRSAWAQYSIQVDGRAKIQAALKEKGVPTAIYYPRPLHLQSAFAGLGYRQGDFPVTETVSERIMSLPMYPYLEEADIERVVAAIGAAL